MERSNYNNIVKYLYNHCFFYFNDNKPTNNYHDYEADKNQSRMGNHGR